ncbi:hypothetical protein G9A89_017049 [Geosiphon pyriformis]|nr:hypothetical protein G9A89_017049 [Geosiphon pyriformis]
MDMVTTTTLRKKLGKQLKNTTTINLIESLSIIQRTQPKPSDNNTFRTSSIELALSTKLQLARLYAKKNVPISCLAAFGGKLWAQVVSLASPSDGFPSGSGSLSGDFCILKKLSFVDLVPLASTSYAPSMAGSVSLVLVVDLDMALDDMLASSVPPLSGSDESAAGLSSSSSKVFISKIGGLESKLSVLEALFSLILANIVHWHISSGNMVSFVAETKLRFSSELWIRNKFDGVQIFTSGLDIGYLSAGVAVIMNNSLAHHVSRVEEVPGHLISIWLLFNGKLLVTILGLYADAFPGTSTFVILGGDFNKNNSGKSASFKFCLGLGLVNSFAKHSLVKMATWSNSRGVEKTIDFILVSGTLSFAVIKHCVNSLSDFFNMDHKSVMILVGLSGLLDVRLNGLCKQANKDHWKFKIKDADNAEWSHFKKCSSAKMLEVKGRFLGAAAGLDLDAMWSLLEKVVVDFADEIFSRHWFCDFQCSKNKHFSRFLGLELLVAKIVKCLISANTSGFDQFVKKWLALDAGKALVLENMVCGGQKVEDLLSYLSVIRKGYRKFKMFESKLLQETIIRKTIKRCMEQFCLDKESMIKSVLDWPFRKMVLDHLVINDELILELEENYVRNDAFSNVINVISISELLLVTNGLPDDKAAGLSGIPNEL